MMRTPSSLLACATLTLSFGLLLGCPSVDDPFDSFGNTLNPTATLTAEGDGDGDNETSDTGTSTGDGDGDTTGGDGDGDTTGGDGDGDPGCVLGSFNCGCDNGVCDDGLTCNADDICELGGGDGDGDPTTGGGDDPWNPDPATCMPPAQPLGVMGVEGSFCSDPCVSDADCPPGPAGTQPACALTMNDPMVPEFCALLCAPGSTDCPAGSTCKEVQPGTGLCTYP